MPLQATSGAASYDAFGGGVAAVPNYIEDVFSTYLYTGNGSTQTITNGIDLAGKGGLIWFKRREAVGFNALFDTVRGVNKLIYTNTTDAQVTTSAGYDLTAFNADGFSLGPNLYTGSTNASGASEASWTFRRQPKFFDVVTYTGNSSTRTISHSLASAPGMIIIKRTTDLSDWWVWHRTFSANEYVMLNSTAAKASGANSFISSDSTGFTIGSESNINGSGNSYVAYLFAHDAGGFGLTGTDNVISCGSFTTDGSGTASVTLGYEPQWLLAKRVDTTGNWELRDSMRYWPVDDIVNGQAQLFPNLSNAESNSGLMRSPTATGFAVSSHSASATYIYIAIRRGPMKVPTSGTSVFMPFASSAASGTTLTTNFPVDSAWFDFRGGDTNNATVLDRLRGTPQTSTDTASNLFLRTSGTAAETTTTVAGFQWWNTGINIGPYYGGYSTAYWMFKRAPSFFDEVCYTGTGSATTVTHNLTVAPELMIVKQRNIGGYWMVYPVHLGNKYLVLQLTDAVANAFTGLWNNTAPTSSVFSLGTGSDCNQSGGTYVAYLFATCAGVSKCGTFTGNGSSQTINCDFTGGARFVMIKATSTTGDWMVADSARGIVSGSDPYLELNNTNAEVTGEDWLDTDSTGFVVNEVSGSNANTNGVTYIYLAIA